MTVRAALAAVLGTATVVGAFALLLVSPGGGSDSALVITLAVLVGVVGVIGALVKVAGSDGDDAAPAPWDERGALVDRAPERSPATDDLSGERLAAVVQAAGETARDDGTVAAGVAAVRPSLREALLGVLVQGGTDRTTAERMIAEGTWTDDETAAAALDPGIDHPGWSVLERFEAWLFPEQLVRREVRTSMRAIAALAERELPTVPGQHAPRTVPVLEPTLEDLRRGADGHLQRAVDPLAARSGSDVDVARTVDAGRLSPTSDAPEATDPDGSGDEPDAGGASGPDPDRSTAAPEPASLDEVGIGVRPDDGADEEVPRR